MQLHWLPSEIHAFGDGTFSANVRGMGNQTWSTCVFPPTTVLLPQFPHGRKLSLQRVVVLWNPYSARKCKIPTKSQLYFGKGVKQLEIPCKKRWESFWIEKPKQCFCTAVLKRIQ